MSATIKKSLFIGAIFLITVFGTYGTYRGGLSLAEEGYLFIAFPLAIVLFSFLFLANVVKQGLKINCFAIRCVEVGMLITFYIVTVGGLFSAPHKLPSTFSALAAGVVFILFITNYSKNDFILKDSINTLCVYLYSTALIAVAAGLWSLYVGSFSIGPIYIEYNKLFWRVNSWFITSTAFGLFQVYAILAAIYLIQRSRLIGVRLPLFFSILLFLFGMSLSGARTAFIALGLSLLGALMALVSLKKKHVVTVGFVSVTIIIFAIYRTDQWDSIYVIRRFFDDGADTAQLGGRLEIFQSIIPALRSMSFFSFLFGSGVGTFQEVTGSSVGAHSGVLRIAIENGILGLVLYLLLSAVLLFRTFMGCWKRATVTPEDIFLFMMVITFLSSEFVVQQLMAVSVDTLIFYAVVGFVISRRRLRLRERHLRQAGRLT